MGRHHSLAGDSSQHVRYLSGRPAGWRTRAAAVPNAGHDLPYVRHADGVSELSARGMPLGLMPNMSYERRKSR